MLIVLGSVLSEATAIDPAFKTLTLAPVSSNVITHRAEVYATTFNRLGHMGMEVFSSQEQVDLLT